jgi:hypothetical protein
MAIMRAASVLDPSVFGRHLLVAEGTHDELAVDNADLMPGAELEGVGGDAVDLAEATLGLLVNEGDGVGGEELAVGSGAFEAKGDVFCGVAGGRLAEAEAGVDARPERAVLGQGEPLAGLGQTAGQRIQPGINMRFASLDRIYHQVSGAQPANQKYHAAISFAIWRVYGGTDKYEFLLTGEDAVDTVAAKIVATFHDVALPFFANHSTVADVDRLYNTAPTDYTTVVHHANTWTRCAFATIAARLTGNPNYDDLVQIYDGVLKSAQGGFHHEKYMALIKLLEREGPARVQS